MSTKSRTRKPATKNPGTAGRPMHKPDAKGRSFVEVMAGLAIPQLEIAAAVGIAQKTLLKHYAEELERGSAKVQCKLVGNLFAIAGGRDGTALKANMFLLNCRFGWTQYAPAPPTKVPTLGKKEQAMVDAETAHEGTSWGEILSRRKPQRLQ